MTFTAYTAEECAKKLGYNTEYFRNLGRTLGFPAVERGSYFVKYYVWDSVLELLVKAGRLDPMTAIDLEGK